MKNIHWLIRRELWEHKVEMIWAPVAATSLATIATAIWMIAIRGMNESRLVVDGAELNLLSSLTANDAALFSSAAIYCMVAMAYVLASLTGIVIANYCLNALFTERQDQSILFWKSLPIQDWETVLSKAAIALLVAPLFTTAVILVGLGLTTFIAAIGLSGLPDSELLRQTLQAAFLTACGKVLATLPFQLIWMIPSVGWFLLVSSVARTNPLLWAVTVPGAVLLLKEFAVFVAQVDPSGLYFLSTVRWLAGTIPASWYLLDKVSLDLFTGDGLEYLYQLWSTFSWKPLLAGTAFGLAMIITTIAIRRSGKI